MWEDYSPRLDFGKYAGHRIADVDSGYLSWCLANVTRLSWSMRQAMETELRKRHDEGEPRTSKAKKPAGSTTAVALEWRPLVEQWYRAEVLRHHPDKGGDHAVYVALGEAKDRLVKMLVEAKA